MIPICATPGCITGWLWPDPSLFRTLSDCDSLYNLIVLNESVERSVPSLQVQSHFSQKK